MLKVTMKDTMLGIFPFGVEFIISKAVRQTKRDRSKRLREKRKLDEAALNGN